MLAIFCFAFTLSKAQDEYVTPPYGYFGILGNYGKYTSQYGELKTKLLYLDASRLLIKENSYFDFGVPVIGWLLSRAIASGLSSGEDFFDDEGEISYIYFKYGHSVIGLDKAVIGLGVSAEVKGLNIEESQLGNDPMGFISVSPLVYSRINLGPITIVPVFEYNIYNYTKMYVKDDVKRTGYSLTTHLVVSLGSNLGLNISPMYSVGNYKTSTAPDPNNNNFIPTDWESTNVFIRVGLVKKI